MPAKAAFRRMSRLHRSPAASLAARLDRFVEEGLMTAAPGPAGHAEYRLTEKDLDLKPVIIALTEWGDRWAAPDGPPIVYEHGRCGGHVRSRLECDRCG